ncbi:MAG: phosphate-binding protein, partial [Lactococcus raffinolactis]
EHMYTKGQPNSLTKSFLDYVLSDAVQDSLVQKMGYISVNQMNVERDADGRVTTK